MIAVLGKCADRMYVRELNWAGANDIEARSALQTLVVSGSSLISRAHASRQRMSYLDIAANTFVGRIGGSRIRAPTAAKIAFPMAARRQLSQTHQVPKELPHFSMNSMSDSGASPIRSGVQLSKLVSFT